VGYFSFTIHMQKIN